MSERFTIVHVSDWHTTAKGARRILHDWFEANKPHTRFDGPGMVAVTGDMVVNFRSWLFKDYGYEGVQQREEWEGIAQELQEAFPALPIVAVRGNHDYCDYGIKGLVRAFDKPGHARMIKVGGVYVSGFRGVPHHAGAWSDEQNERYFETAMWCTSRKTQVLLTHAPPFGVLDCVQEGGEFAGGWTMPPTYIGSHGIKDALGDFVNLKAHCFGHVHEKGGKTYQNGVRYSNAAETINIFTIEV